MNILRGALAILVAIASQPSSPGFQALQPAIALYPQFLEVLVTRLSSADHALCANALQLINSLLRESITKESETEWPKFVKKLQDLGVIKAVYGFMQGSALQDLAQPVLEFQVLSKILLKKWRGVPLDLDKAEHRRALKCLHIASNPDKPSEPMDSEDRASKSKSHNPEKWRRLGFETETPAFEFEDVGFLGMMDLTNYVRKNEDNYQRLLLEQSAKPTVQRCPIARAGLAVTALLYDLFEVEKADIDDAKEYIALESKSNFRKAFKPLLLQWSTLHGAGVNAFFRLWSQTGARHEDFGKMVELVRVLLDAVIGGASRTKELRQVEDEIRGYDCHRLRQLQMELLEMTYDDAWGHHLRQVKDELNHEALHFVKEQRIRCLLQGAWFPNLGYKADAGPVTKQDLKRSVPSSYRYIKLSNNRRHLHYADFDYQGSTDLSVSSLPERIDLNLVSSVVSNVSTDPEPASSTETLRDARPSPSTKITIWGHGATASSDGGSSSRHAHGNSIKSSGTRKEAALLTLHPQTKSSASEWLDGLLMLLNQQPITAETTRLLALVSNYGLKIRLLNVRFDDAAFAGEEPEIPSRDGLDEDYYFDINAGAQEVY